MAVGGVCWAGSFGVVPGSLFGDFIVIVHPPFLDALSCSPPRREQLSTLLGPCGTVILVHDRGELGLLSFYIGTDVSFPPKGANFLLPVRALSFLLIRRPILTSSPRIGSSVSVSPAARGKHVLPFPDVSLSVTNFVGRAPLEHTFPSNLQVSLPRRPSLSGKHSPLRLVFSRPDRFRTASASTS